MWSAYLLRSTVHIGSASVACVQHYPIAHQASTTSSAATPTSTCPNIPPFQTSWTYVAPPRNAKLDFGPSNGKASNGQPKPGGPTGSKKVKNFILTNPDGFGPASEFGSDTIQIGSIRITHATPASFASHIYDRDQEEIIAEQLIGDQPLGPVADLMLGGGLAFFWPNTTTGSSRKDSRDLIAEAKKAGYIALTTRAGFDALGGGKTAKLPYLGLFTPGHMSYEVDRDPKFEPSLLEMTNTALETLKRATKDSKKGYFIMVEASRIDYAGHSNDLIGQHEIIMYNEVVDYLKKWVGDNDDTVLIGTADHECAGLAVGGIVTTGEYRLHWLAFRIPRATWPRNGLNTTVPTLITTSWTCSSSTVSAMPRAQVQRLLQRYSFRAIFDPSCYGQVGYSWTYRRRCQSDRLRPQLRAVGWKQG
ncbi:hypothetical protein RSAG8_04100, partial [Rhizoctonia solani AG-8 WAC10335]